MKKVGLAVPLLATPLALALMSVGAPSLAFIFVLLFLGSQGSSLGLAAAIGLVVFLITGDPLFGL